MMDVKHFLAWATETFPPYGAPHSLLLQHDRVHLRMTVLHPSIDPKSVVEDPGPLGSITMGIAVPPMLDHMIDVSDIRAGTADDPYPSVFEVVEAELSAAVQEWDRIQAEAEERRVAYRKGRP